MQSDRPSLTEIAPDEGAYPGTAAAANALWEPQALPAEVSGFSWSF
jgi:hypothetical protein